MVVVSLRAGRRPPARVPERRLLVEAGALRAVGVENGARDLRGVRRGGALQPQGVEDLLADEHVERLPADLGEDLAEDQEVGVGVAPVRPRLEERGLRERVVEAFLDRGGAERVALEGVAPSLIELVVRVPRRLVRDHLHGDLVGVGQVREPLVDRVVERHLLLVDELHEQVAQVLVRDGAVAEPHLRRGRHVGHRLAPRLADDDLVARGDLDDDRLEADGLHRVLDDLGDLGRLLRLRRRLRPRRRGQQRHAPERQRDAGRHDSPTPATLHGPSCGAAARRRSTVPAMIDRRG